ncbi:hypothetical protein PHLCEN_2v11849 [Hermanssonia centrifuga]|uniref:Uncharacterized protein n=1 Tax=Hermanssonia centrifuga TaxID=98765 RepID=A0A2R6NIP7_9APHY|nr:hypothetical protein PHLCEN_2v11849 [Hermanssonia centrifuga]
MKASQIVKWGSLISDTSSWPCLHFDEIDEFWKFVHRLTALRTRVSKSEAEIQDRVDIFRGMLPGLPPA